MKTISILSLASLIALSALTASAQDSYEAKNHKAGVTKKNKKGLAKLLSGKTRELNNPFLTSGDEFEADYRKASANVKLPKPGTIITCYDGEDYNVFSVGIIDGKEAIFELSDGSNDDGTTPYYVTQKTASGVLALDTALSKDSSGYLIRQASNGTLYIDSVEMDEDALATFKMTSVESDALIDPNDGIHQDKVQVCPAKL